MTLPLFDQLRPYHEAVLIRGPQGSGKSTRAQQFAARGGCAHIEADDYFLDEYGVYRFVEGKHQDAHRSCKEEARAWAAAGYTPVIANTFSMRHEIKAYLSYLDVEVSNALVLSCHRPGWTAEDYAAKSEHKVPVYVISRLLRRWQPWEGEICLF